MSGRVIMKRVVARRAVTVVSEPAMLREDKGYVGLSSGENGKGTYICNTASISASCCVSPWCMNDPSMSILTSFPGPNLRATIRFASLIEVLVINYSAALEGACTYPMSFPTPTLSSGDGMTSLLTQPILVNLLRPGSVENHSNTGSSNLCILM